jgi:type II secretory ATPase GspE/PulE/Tfp pilus assembly ATPase PilB-like protein
LHSFLNYINSPGKNIITIEDPVEYKNEKLNQIQINPEINFTFYEALKRVLRQDPDIIMLGEIRDQKSAEIAIKSSLTGHLVLSTLHTNSAKESINRLLDLNVKPFLISSSLLCIISQKLVKILCEKCKVQLPTGDFKSKGCSNCNQTGFSSRKLVYEYFEPTEQELEELLNNKTTNIKESNELVKSLEKLVNSGYIEKNNLNI